MARHGSDEVTFYFVLISNGGHTQIQAWSENKDYADYYMKFHKCRAMSIKKMHGFYEDIVKVLDENFHDEIHMYNITIRNPDVTKRKKHPLKAMVIPATDTEIMFINGEMSSFMATRVDYHFIEACSHFLKGKYLRAMNDCLLTPVMAKVIHEQNSQITSSMSFDQLKILVESFPDHFGE